MSGLSAPYCVSSWRKYTASPFFFIIADNHYAVEILFEKEFDLPENVGQYFFRDRKCQVYAVESIALEEDIMLPNTAFIGPRQLVRYSFSQDLDSDCFSDEGSSSDESIEFI